MGGRARDEVGGGRGKCSELNQPSCCLLCAVTDSCCDVMIAVEETSRFSCWIRLRKVLFFVFLSSIFASNQIEPRFRHHYRSCQALQDEVHDIANERNNRRILRSRCDRRYNDQIYIKYNGLAITSGIETTLCWRNQMVYNLSKRHSGMARFTHAGPWVLHGGLLFLLYSGASSICWREFAQSSWSHQLDNF